MATKSTNKGASVTALVKLIRKLPEYEQWRRAVFIRDRFQCQHCGRRNGKKPIIEADHIESFAKLVRVNEIKTIEQGLACASLWDINNGRTLCRKCHQETESYPTRLKDKQGNEKQHPRRIK